MPKQPPSIESKSEFRDVHFPLAGIDLSMAAGKQPNRPTGQRGEYRRTCAVAKNVRGHEPLTGRARGAQRAGLSKYLPLQVAGELFIVQHLAAITGTGGAVTQLSQSGRVVTLVAVSEGRVFYANAGDDAWLEATNNTGETPPLNFTGIMFSAPNQQKLWFVDGVNACYYVPITNTVEAWTASAGIFPVDSDGNLPRLCCTWRGRLVLSGLLKDAQNIFMSAVDDPRDFDYSPTSPSATDAVALNLSSLGLIGDVVTCLIPYTDDVLVVGGDHTIWMIRGDPLDGGRTDLVSSSIGMAWGEPYCLDPYGNIYFFSNRTGIFTLVPGQQPQRISQAIETLLKDIDTGLNSIRLMWNDELQGLEVLITWLDEPADTTHFLYEARTGAWFTREFANHDHNPLCCCVFDGNLASDRVCLIGSWDGYVRALDPTATDDDGTPIASRVVIGPIVTGKMGEVIMTGIFAEFAKDSSDVTYNILVGDTPEEALVADPFLSGTWTAGLNPTTADRVSAHSLYVEILGDNKWAMEKMRLRVADLGKVRARNL